MADGDSPMNNSVQPPSPTNGSPGYGGAGPGVCHVHNKEIIQSMVANAMDEENDSLRFKKTNTNRSGMTNRSTLNPKEEKKHKDIMGKLNSLRDRDQRFIKEQVDLQHEIREQRFERLMASVSGEDMYLKSKVSDLLRTNAMNYQRKQRGIYNDWNDNVFGSISQQLHGFLNPDDRGFMQSLQGTRNVEFKMPETKNVVSISRGSTGKNAVIDPTSKGLYQAAEENAFRRKMDLVLPPPMKEGEFGPYTEQFDPNTLGIDVSALPHPLLARSRPVLEPDMWGQLKLQSTPYGQFAQACEAGKDWNGGVKRGNHVPPERDGVEAAGKRKTRWTLNDVGILKGEIANRGQSIENKQGTGASCGAPNQDHFTYSAGAKIVDTEFPLGKRMMKHKH